MKRLIAIRTLPLIALLALGPVLPAPAEEKGLPQFNLNAVKISGLPKLSDFAIPQVPPPTDTGYYSRTLKGGVRLDSSVTVVVDGEKGKAEIRFPKVKYVEARTGFRSSLFVKFAPHDPTAVLSWAAVLCSGPTYLGYKGSSLEFPAEAGNFVIKDDTLSLGSQKSRLGRTHPWVVQGAKDGARNLDRLCSTDFPGKMKAYAVKALPAEAEGFAFKYDPETNLLTVNWTR